MSSSSYASPLQPLAVPEPGRKAVWGRLYGCGKSLVISRTAIATQKPVVFFTRDNLSASQTIDELRFFCESQEDLEILAFPDWETLPYDQFSPYQDIISERLATLARLADLSKLILVVPVTTALHRLIPCDFLRSHSLCLQKGQQLDMDSFRRDMSGSGYSFTSQVMEHGDIAIRGSIIDIFPMGARYPFRIDLFDNEIESIRSFDPETQRSVTATDTINVLPAREVALFDEGIAHFRAAWRERFSGNPANSPVYRDVSQGLAPAGIEYYLPLFYLETSSLFDYLQDDTIVFMDEEVPEIIQTFWQDTEARYEQFRHDVERPVLQPRELYLDNDAWMARVKPYSRVFLSTGSRQDHKHATDFATTIPVQLPVDARAPQPLAVLKRYIEKFHGQILFAAESAGRREMLSEMFRQNDLRVDQVDNWTGFLQSGAGLAMLVAPLEQGIQVDQPALSIISESQLFGERAQQRRLRKRRQQDSDAIVSNLNELTIGAPVVHEDHGVGRYQGLVTLTVNQVPAEFICVEYAQQDKLYVPVATLDLISRYTGVDPEHAPLHRLGSGQWEKARDKAARRIHDVAAELLEMHARRASRKGNSLSVNESEYYSFIQSFPFEETPGQLEAIQAVIADLEQDKPMDRLVCGDAGFGKTEVAMRAAFITVQNGKQVAVLVPTTLLAQQHYQNFTDRFSDWPVKIESLSRFRSVKEQEKVLRGLAEGQVDIVIGTHKLIQNNVQFKRLGLLIIDEEHRFGVRQKEKFKSLRSEIDVLTLTATPIPRTLNMALSNLRELSIIATPPSRRLSVKTFVREWNNNVIQEAILREIKRGGQVYFLHNQIDTIENMARDIEKLMPDARVRVAHGQMPEKQLEQVMLDFYHRRFNVLVCTTIIETGIDVPSANTIIINRADKFGLAQLYQLRGRVGRSHHRAYAYLIVPTRKSMTADAVKRLEAIESLEELGVGFTLATHDLEIRGAGEILGEEQSGQIHEIGFGLYMELLERAIHSMQSGRQPELDRPLDHGAEIELHIPALIPEDYLPDVHSRLIMYKRIASASNQDQLDDLQEEMIDRFGLLPDYLKNLFRITSLKLLANPLGIRKIDLGQHGGRIFFDKATPVDPVKIIELIQKQSKIFRLDGEDKLRITKDLPESADRFTMLSHLFDILRTGNAGAP